MIAPRGATKESHERRRFPMSTYAAKRVSTRDLLLDAAFDLFAEIGFAGTTISEIERRVGLAAGSGSFYRHFSSKEELLPAAVERELSKAIADVHSAFPDAAQPREPREVWLRRILMWLRRTERLNRLLLLEGDRVPVIRAAITSAVQVISDELSWDDDPAGIVGVAALHGYLLFSRAIGGPYYDVDEDEFIAALATLAPRRQSETVQRASTRSVQR
jgi:AcrR family transcriptional regulator